MEHAGRKLLLNWRLTSGRVAEPVLYIIYFCSSIFRIAIFIQDLFFQERIFPHFEKDLRQQKSVKGNRDGNRGLLRESFLTECFGLLVTPVEIHLLKVSTRFRELSQNRKAGQYLQHSSKKLIFLNKCLIIVVTMSFLEVPVSPKIK